MTFSLYLYKSFCISLVFLLLDDCDRFMVIQLNIYTITIIFGGGNRRLRFRHHIRVLLVFVRFLRYLGVVPALGLVSRLIAIRVFLGAVLLLVLVIIVIVAVVIILIIRLLFIIVIIQILLLVARLVTWRNRALQDEGVGCISSAGNCVSSLHHLMA